MKSSKFHDVILDENDIFQGLYSGRIVDISNINIDDLNVIQQFNSAKSANADRFPNLELYKEPEITKEEYDCDNQNKWFMPDSYYNLEIESYLLSLCKTVEEVDRVAEELELFYQHNMITVLKYLKYLVDTLRENNIVWGVGRGSSVASYCLFLLGVHKIDSIKYKLDINEFLK